MSPDGDQVVGWGSTNLFTLTASNWYHVASVVVDGTNVGPPDTFTFGDVVADHTLVANFAPDLATNQTPNWWLYQANPDWSTNFDAAAIADADGDGQLTWQEYLAGTDPRNPASVFRLTIAISNGQTVLSFPTIAPTAQYEGLRRYYSLEYSTNLLSSQAWQGFPGGTNLPSAGQTIVRTNPAGNVNRLFRAKVWLEP